MRFTIRQLLFVTAFLALSCAALLGASSMWGAALWTCLAFYLAVAVLLAIFKDGSARAYWIGFALMGWLYFVLYNYGWAVVELQNMYNVDHDSSSRYFRSWGIGNLLTTHLSRMAYRWLLTLKVISPNVDVMNFINVAHALWAVLVALTGGALARWLNLSDRQIGRTLPKK